MGVCGECSKELLQLPELVLSRGQGLTSVCTPCVPTPHTENGRGMKHYRSLKKVPVPAGTDVLAWTGDRGYLVGTGPGRRHALGHLGAWIPGLCDSANSINDGKNVLRALLMR